MQFKNKVVWIKAFELLPFFSQLGLKFKCWRHFMPQLLDSALSVTFCLDSIIRGGNWRLWILKIWYEIFQVYKMGTSLNVFSGNLGLCSRTIQISQDLSFMFWISPQSTERALNHSLINKKIKLFNSLVVGESGNPKKSKSLTQNKNQGTFSNSEDRCCFIIKPLCCCSRGNKETNIWSCVTPSTKTAVKNVLERVCVSDSTPVLWMMALCSSWAPAQAARWTPHSASWTFLVFTALHKEWAAPGALYQHKRWVWGCSSDPDEMCDSGSLLVWVGFFSPSFSTDQSS